MAISGFGQWALVLVTAMAVAGCEDGIQLNAGNATGAGGTARTAAQDVEAPEVFSADAEGLWDGRPSLGGVWVAHPSVTEPQRAMILNKANGNSVVGALFRRERENPGPPFQVSSDAAEKLGLLAGQPAQLHVVALKREEPPEPETPEASEPLAGEEGAATETAAAAATPAPQDGQAADTAALTAGIETALDAAAEPVPEDRPPSSFGRRAPAAEAAPAEAAAAESLEAQPVPEDRPPTSFGRRQPRATPATGASDDITVAPLDATGATEAAPAPSGSIERPYIQAAIFGTEANAETAAKGLRDAGLAVTIKETTSNGTTYWRVLVGPAGSAGEQSSLLEKARGLGYRDAYAVSG